MFPTKNATKVASSNPANGNVYSVQLYVINFVSDLRHVGGFLVGYTGFHHHLSQKYIWNIVQSGAKYHNLTTLLNTNVTLKYKNEQIFLEDLILCWKCLG